MAGWSRSLRAEDDTRGDGRADFSNILGLGNEVELSVWRRASRRDPLIKGSAEDCDAKSTTDVVRLSDGLLSGLRVDFDLLRVWPGGVSLRLSAMASSSDGVD
jgi:hypothetical protein